MAIYVYKTADGTLVSYIPDSLTIAQAQTQKLLAPTATLTANGMTAVDGLAPLDDTHAWNPATHTVIVVVAPTPVNLINTFDFIMAFTPAELAAIRASSNNNIQQFLFAFQVTQGLNLNSTVISNALNFLVAQTLLTAPRASTILATAKSGAAGGGTV